MTTRRHKPSRGSLAWARERAAAKGPAQNRTEAGRFAPGASGNPSTQFQPGQSGNPGGRPRGLAQNIREMYGYGGEGLIVELGRILRSRGSAWARVQAVRELLDRGWGKAPQEVTVSIPTATDDVDLAFATAEEIALMRSTLQTIAARARAARSPEGQVDQGRNQRQLPVASSSVQPGEQPS